MKGKFLCRKLLAALLCTSTVLLNVPAVYAASESEAVSRDIASEEPEESFDYEVTEDLVFDGINDVVVDIQALNGMTLGENITLSLSGNGISQEFTAVGGGETAKIIIHAEELLDLGMERADYEVMITFDLIENGSPTPVNEKRTLTSKVDSKGKLTGNIIYPATELEFDGTEDIVLNYELEGELPEGYEVLVEDSTRRGDVKVNGQEFTDYALTPWSTPILYRHYTSTGIKSRELYASLYKRTD